MNLAELGEQIDIHGGGNDLVFPHHENEIAQTESLTGRFFARYWVHNGMLQLSGEKMSKSKRNVVAPEVVADTYGVDCARWFMLSDTPPERDSEWTQGGIEGAWRFVQRVWRLVNEAVELGAAPGAARPEQRVLGHAHVLIEDLRVAADAAVVLGGHFIFAFHGWFPFDGRDV